MRWLRKYPGHFLTFMWPCIVLNFLVIKTNRCTNFSILFLEWNSTCFGQFLCPLSGVFHCTHSNGICYTGSLTACSQAVSKTVWHIPLLYVQWKTPDDGQRNCSKHVEFHSKNKSEKLVHLVGFITRKSWSLFGEWNSHPLVCHFRKQTYITRSFIIPSPH